MTNTNDLKLKHYRKKQVYRYLIVILNLCIIALEAFALFGQISYFWGFVPFVLVAVVKYLLVKME